MLTIRNNYLYLKIYKVPSTILWCRCYYYSQCCSWSYLKVTQPSQSLDLKPGSLEPESVILVQPMLPTAWLWWLQTVNYIIPCYRKEWLALYNLDDKRMSSSFPLENDRWWLLGVVSFEEFWIWVCTQKERVLRSTKGVWQRHREIRCTL